MKILVLTDAFPPDHTGGISKSLRSEVLALVARGHDVTVVTRRHSADAPGEEATDGFRLIRYAAPRKGTRAYYLHPWVTMATVPGLIRRLHRATAFDAAYVHNTFQAAALARSGVRIRKVWSFHAPAPAEIALDASKGKYGALGKVVGWLRRHVLAVEAHALKSMDVVVTRSGFMSDQVDGHYPELEGPIRRIVPLCVDTKRYTPGGGVAAARADLGLPADRYVIVTVRRLVARMGIENLLAAMAELFPRHPNALLVICGTGYMAEELREKAHRLGLKNHVRFEGFVDEDRLPLYYRAADLFCLPSAELEGFGLVTIEALASGTPVLATPVGANASVVGPLGREHLTQTASAAAIADGLATWIRNGTSEAERLRCRDYCVSRFSFGTVAEMLEATLQSPNVSEGILATA